MEEADKLIGTSHQISINHLVEQLAQGNLRPGIGTNHLFGNIIEARAKDGSRVYFRIAADEIVEVLAKSTKANQPRVIRLLEEVYG